MVVMGLGRARRLYQIALIGLLLSFPFFIAHAQIPEVGDGGPGPVKAQHLTAELTSLSPQITPGGTQTIGLVLTIEEHWHVYWINAGDSGEPPAIKWTLPKGFTAGPLQFPPPQRLPLGPLMDFGYEDQVAFPITLTAPANAKLGKTHLDAHVTWLVCAQVCLPGKAHLGLDMNVVRGPIPPAPVVGALGEALNLLPKPLPSTMSASAVGDAKHIALTLHTGTHEQDAEFYPFDPEIIENAADQEIQSLPDGVRITLQRANDSLALPKSLHGLVKFSDTESYDVTTPVTPGVITSNLTPAAKAAKQVTPSSVTIFGAIGLAFIGGIILNLMPCVFPVLFLKGLALLNSSNEEKHRQRLHGLVYTLGILVSFWIIVAALLLLRAGGRELGWGFQLQSPGFVAVLASLLFFLALSLAGQFEIGLSLTSAGGDLAQKQGYTGSFFTGVLATVVATPCTAPLMGAAVGFALSHSAWMTFAIFTAVALGLALPYLVLTMNPHWTSVLPKPGAWMETLKQLTAVPLFATALWLTWVYAHLYASEGVDRMTRLLVCFLIIAIAGWVLGKWPAKWSSAIAAVILIACGLALPLSKPAAETMTWQRWTPATFQAARATGKPVFVDFTADWCLSCKFNEATVLRSSEVEQKLRDDNVQLLKADWTQYDPEITKQLSAVERSGVPTYVIYPAGKNSNADVLPELLTKDIVLKALEKDAHS